MINDSELPSAAKRIADSYPELWDAFTLLGRAASGAGPLEGKMLRLIKIALAVGAGLEGAVHSHTRQALAEGVTADDIKHVALAAIPTLGFSSAVRALSWIEDMAGR